MMTPSSTTAVAEALAAYNTLKGLASTGVLAAELGNTTIYPGVYTNASSVGITLGDLTLDAQGNPDAYWIWQVGNSATINGAGGGTMVGTIISRRESRFQLPVMPR